jgi:hypothetical protein
MLDSAINNTSYQGLLQAIKCLAGHVRPAPDPAVAELVQVLLLLAVD